MDRRTQQYLIAGGILLAGLLLGRACSSGGDGSSLPEIEPGKLLVSLQFQGEKSIVLPKDTRVEEVAGTWVSVRFPGDDEDGARWLDFGRLSAYTLASDD